MKGQVRCPVLRRLDVRCVAPKDQCPDMPRVLRFIIPIKKAVTQALNGQHYQKSKSVPKGLVQ